MLCWHSELHFDYLIIENCTTTGPLLAAEP